MTRYYEAKPGEAHKIMDCAKMFTDIIPMCNFDKDNYTKEWDKYIKSGIGVLFIAEDDNDVHGALGAIRFIEPLTGDMTAVELCWFVKPQYRKTSDAIKLYNMYEKWAKSQGCKKIAMIHLMCSMPDRLEEFYKKKGYTLIEKHYQKEI